MNHNLIWWEHRIKDMEPLIDAACDVRLNERERAAAAEALYRVVNSAAVRQAKDQA